MSDILIVYGSTTGNIENAAELIAENLQPFSAQLIDVVDVEDTDFENFDTVIFGISTWEYGGLQEDWIEYFPFFENVDFTGKVCALFGQGDQVGYADWFQDALGDVYNVLIRNHAQVTGKWLNEGYSFGESRGLTADKKYFYGLALDDDNQPELTEPRIQQWVAQLKHSLRELNKLEAATDPA